VHETVMPTFPPRQSTGDLIELLQTAFLVKRNHYDPFFTALKEADNRFKFFDSKLKGIWRCVEKMELKKETLDSCENICDVVTVAVCSIRIAALVDVYQRTATQSHSYPTREEQSQTSQR
jgi:hypothetical protein